ncbi:hypothetical protein X777_13805, partial [Ooceraea biroi]
VSVVHPNLPKSYKSLLKTPSHLNIIEVEQAQIWYKSIRFNLDAMLLEEYLKTYNQICIDVNIDGLPIFKSSPRKFWPIEKHSTDVRSFLNNFVNEVEDLYENGYTFNGITYSFLVRNFILDAAARSLVKCLKNLLKSCYKPLQQAARRDLERTVSVSVHLTTNNKAVTLSHRHYCGGEIIEGSYFQDITIGDVVLKIGRRDSCFMTIDGTVMVLLNIVKRQEDIYLITNKFKTKENFLVYPFPSSLLRIFKVSNLDDQRIVMPLASVQSKCWLIPYKGFYVSVPLLHSFVVFKFILENDNNDIYYDVGLTKWLIGVNEDMEGETYWPPHNIEAGSLIRKEVDADKTWPKFRVRIKRYHGTYLILFISLVFRSLECICGRGFVNNFVL